MNRHKPIAHVEEAVTRGELYRNGVRKRVRQQGNTVALDNARETPPSYLNSGRRFVRQELVGICLLLLGPIFLTVPLVALFTKVEVSSTPDSRAGGIVVGLLCLLAGYAFLAVQNAFVVDVAARRWRTVVGLSPFLQQARGALSDARGLRVVPETRRAYQTWKRWDYDVWAVHLLWNDNNRPPMVLNALDLPATAVERAQAEDVYRWYADLIGLSLLSESA